MPHTSDPRVFFAAERTLLAWVRTGVTLMAFGFVVARFGLFLSLLRMQAGQAHTGHAGSLLSTLLGTALVLLGAFVMAVSAYQHRVFVRTLPAHDLPPGYSTALALLLASLLSSLGLALAGYLAAS
jgi:putative membrane protein